MAVTVLTAPARDSPLTALLLAAPPSRGLRRGGHAGLRRARAPPAERRLPRRRRPRAPARQRLPHGPVPAGGHVAAQPRTPWTSASGCRPACCAACAATSTAPRPAAAACGRGAATCRWQTVEGRAQRTRYAVRLHARRVLRGGRDAAPRQPRYDVDHPHLLGEDPLNALGSAAARMLRPHRARRRGRSPWSRSPAAAAAAKPHAANPPAQPYSKRSTAPGGRAARDAAATTAQPIATYKRYVAPPAARAARRGRRPARRDRSPRPGRRARRVARRPTPATSRSAPPTAPSATSTPRSTARPAGLPGGVRSPDFTGPASHRAGALAAGAPRARPPRPRRSWRATSRACATERRARWRSTRSSTRCARTRSSRTASTCSSPGRRARGAASALVALRARGRAARSVVLDTLRADDRAPRRRRRAAAGAQRAAPPLDGARAPGARPTASLPRWDALGQRDRELVDGLTAGAAEQLAYVPELIDPRPPRPAQRAFGDSG